MSDDTTRIDLTTITIVRVLEGDGVNVEVGWDDDDADYLTLLGMIEMARDTIHHAHRPD